LLAINEYFVATRAMTRLFGQTQNSSEFPVYFSSEQPRQGRRTPVRRKPTRAALENPPSNF
jgi:hypothetical protein